MFILKDRGMKMNNKLIKENNRKIVEIGCRNIRKFIQGEIIK
jgi:hypothetical protein